ncbi:MAG: hypothetical protein WCF92_01980 [bacterium]
MKAQKHVRKIVEVDGVELIERLTFYYSIIPESKQKLEEIIEKEFPRLLREKIKEVKQITGALDVIPETPQSKPESFLEYPQFTIYHCDRPKSVAEQNEMIAKAFPNVPFEKVVPMFGIVSTSYTVKK